MTPRQLQITQLLCLGRSVNEIARIFGISRKGVRRHLCFVFERTGCRSQAQLVGWAVCHGVVSTKELQAVYGQVDQRAVR